LLFAIHHPSDPLNCGSTSLQKNYSLFATRYSPFTIRQSPIAPVLPVASRYSPIAIVLKLGISLALPIPFWLKGAFSDVLIIFRRLI
jgi:hypothetical protein